MIDHQIGTGTLASSGKAVVVHYTGWLFDSAAPAVSTERLSLTTQGNIRYRLKTPYRDGTTDVVFEPLDKIAGSDFEQPQAGPQGAGQDPRSTSWPAWPPWCRRRASTSRALMHAIHGAPPAGALRASKFTPGEFVTACSRRTIDCVSRSPRPGVADARLRPSTNQPLRATSRRPRIKSGAGYGRNV